MHIWEETKIGQLHTIFEEKLPENEKKNSRN